MAKRILAVMGGGVNEDGTLPEYVIRRCIEAKKAWREDDLVIASSSFSLNVPPRLNGQGKIISEASEIYNWLKKNMPSANVMCEQFSHDTIGSVLFVVLLYGWLYKVNEFLFITSDFHSRRVAVITQKVEKILGEKLKIRVESVSSNFFNEERMRKENKSIVDFENEFQDFECIEDLIKHTLENHDNYNHSYSSKWMNLLKMGY